MSRLVRLCTTVFSFFVLSLIAGSGVLAGDGGRRVILNRDGDWFGHDYRVLKDVGLEACKSACLKDAPCRAFTWNGKARWCFLKNGVGELRAADGTVAGRIAPAAARGKPPAPDIGAPRELSVVSAYLKGLARKYRKAVLTLRDRNDRRSAEELSAAAQNLLASAQAALETGRARLAEKTFRLAAALAPENSRAWRGIAEALSRLRPANRNEERNIRNFRLSAAYNAYLTSRTEPDRFAALKEVARALAGQERWRPALEVYKLALKMRSSPALKQEFMDVRIRHGFRVDGYDVEADAKSPRICVKFTERLYETDRDYAPWVRVNGKAPAALDVEGRQICVGGARHGQVYRITLREGLPSTVGEALLSPVALRVFVRDRSPQAHFVNESFILPKVGARGIPLVTINAERVRLRVYRIGPGAIGGLIGEGFFPGLLRGYQTGMITEKFGVLVWKGVLETKGELNKEHVTSAPLEKILPARRPGLYLMTAWPEARPQTDDWEQVATQWFIITDTGLVTYKGAQGLDVFARALSDALPKGGVKLRLMARSGDVLGEAETDARGHARFAPGLMRGAGPQAPRILLASGADGDFTMLDLTRDGFDLSDRGVAGRPPAGALDAFVWLDRGVYRPGETVRAAALLRDMNARAAPGLPLTAIFVRPDGKEERRLVTRDAGAGGHLAELKLSAFSMTGTWTVRFHVDPKDRPLAVKRFLVEEFVPERLSLKLTPATPVADPEKGARIRVEGRFLYGAPAAGLWLEGETVLHSARGLKGFEGYLFGMADEDDISERTKLSDLPKTDENGRAVVRTGEMELPFSTRPLELTVTLRLGEAGGRAVERSVTLPVALRTAMIGVRPAFEGDVKEDSHVRFHVIAVDKNGRRTAMPGARWTLYRVERNYQWARDDEGWSYEAVETSHKVSEGGIDIARETPAEIGADVKWGRYRLEVRQGDEDAADAPLTSVVFDAGWYAEGATADTPDAIEMALDRKSYAPGDKARLSFVSRFAGKGLLVIGSEALREWRLLDVQKGDNSIEIPVGEWGAGAYATVSVFRPGREGARHHLPVRAMGVRWLAVEPGPRRLSVRLDAPARALPRRKLTIPVSVDNLAPGARAFVTVALVDEGILSLTGFATPDPDGWYFGQRRLGLEIIDHYGRLIDSHLGETGRVRSGGDGLPGLRTKGSPPTQPLLALHSGVVRLDENGRGSVTFDTPQFNGRGRLMVVAWTKEGVGHAEAPLVIRDPVVALASAPRFLAPGDDARIRLDIDNVDGPAGEYTLTVTADGGLSVGRGGFSSTLTLEKGGRASLRVPLSGMRPGLSHVTITLAKAPDLSLSQTLTIPVRASQPPVTMRRTLKLAAGARIRLDRDILSGFAPEEATLSVNASHLRGIDVPSLLVALDRYPYGCAEQTVSRALPLIYLPAVAMRAGFGERKDIRARVQKAINRLSAFQAANGGFSLWGADSGHSSGGLWLSAYVTDFLTRAREEKYAVPRQMLEMALDYLQNRLAGEQNVGPGEAYAFYVLARNRRASIGDLRWLAESKLDELKTPLAVAQIGAALALYGDAARAKRTFAEAVRRLRDAKADHRRADYGSVLRDGAAILALAGETRPAAPATESLEAFIARLQREDGYTSTQENAWLLLAARALLKQDDDLLFEVNGMQVRGTLAETYAGAELDVSPVEIVNRSGEELLLRVTTRGAPLDPLPPGGKGFVITRNYFDMDGKPVNIAMAGQNERFVVLLTIRPQNPWPMRLVVSDMLPAGFEIDNPKLVGSAQLEKFSFLPSEITAAHVEFRDDRFIAALDRTGGEKRDIVLAYIVRAVTPGVFAHPPAVVEDMYRPWLNARTASGTVQIIAPKP